MGEKTELMTVDNISNRVYVIRGQQVMLDYDLAEIYGYEVKRLNEQVKRNITRFPKDFMFQLSKDEVDLVKSQFATSPNGNFLKDRRVEEESFLMRSLNKVFICSRQSLGENSQNNKVFLLCVHSAKCVIT